jgi:hypothetical protein
LSGAGHRRRTLLAGEPRTKASEILRRRHFTVIGSNLASKAAQFGIFAIMGLDLLPWVQDMEKGLASIGERLGQGDNALYTLQSVM